MNTESNSLQSNFTDGKIRALDIITPDQFSVTDITSANWVVRRIVESRSYAQAIDRWAEAEKQRCAEIETYFLERYGAELEEFARKAIAEQNEHFRHNVQKSIRLPAGTIGFRTQPVRVRVVDEQEVINWCRCYLPMAIRTTERVSRTMINEHFETTGQLPTGAALDAECNRFYVK